MGRAINERDARRYVEGLLLPSERHKTLTGLVNTEPLVGAQLPRAQKLQWFLSESDWDERKVQAERLTLLREDATTAPNERGVLVIDETGDRKDGHKTAHVGRQYLGNRGKIDNGVVSVTSLWADAQVYYSLEVEPYTPESYFAKGRNDPSFRTKLTIALQLVQQARKLGWPFRAVVADNFYGEDRSLKSGLRKLSVPYVMALKPSHAWWWRALCKTWHVRRAGRAQSSQGSGYRSPERSVMAAHRTGGPWRLSQAPTFSVTDLIVLLRHIRQEQEENWHVEDAARRLRNAGLLEAMGRGSFSFLHQTFQEYLAGYYVALLPSPRAEQEVDQLVEHINGPFSRQIIIELAHVVHQQETMLETYLYQRTIQQYERAKMGLLEAQQTRRLTSSSAISEGCDAVLQILVDIWGIRLCSTLESGSSRRKEDGEVASSIAWVFERNPRAFAVPALIAGLSVYQKRARFIGALGEIGTEEAKQALYIFTVEQLSNPTDLFVFRYLASALGQARIEQAIPLLHTIRDMQDFDFETRFEAHHALRLMGQESDFDEQGYYQIERILQALSIEDEQHRPSDWKRVANMAHWLQANYVHTSTLQVHYQAILHALERALDHKMGSARLAIVNTLGEPGNSSIFTFLLQCLEKHIEPAYDVADLMLRALERLAERQQVNITKEQLLYSFSQIQQHYPALIEEMTSIQVKIQNCIEDNQYM